MRAMHVLTLSALLSLPGHVLADDATLDVEKLGHVVGTLSPALTLEQRICRLDWPCDQAIRVARCESRMDSRALSRGGHIGLFQLAPGHAARIGATPAQLFDADTNIRAAHALYAASGNSWRHWSCRP
jgi:hypothetical protein